MGFTWEAARWQLATAAGGMWLFFTVMNGLMVAVRFFKGRRASSIPLVGTMFGEAGVNIANMAVSRRSEGGKALMAFSIDSAAPAELVRRVAAAGFDDARFLSLA